MFSRPAAAATLAGAGSIAYGTRHTSSCNSTFKQGRVGNAPSVLGVLGCETSLSSGSEGPKSERHIVYDVPHPTPAAPSTCFFMCSIRASISEAPPPRTCPPSPQPATTPLHSSSLPPLPAPLLRYTRKFACKDETLAPPHATPSGKARCHTELFSAVSPPHAIFCGFRES